MPISKIFVVRFFQLLGARRFAEAERVLERIRSSTNETEWNKGYMSALDGVLLAMKTNDSYAFLSNINFEDEKELKKHRKVFLKEYKNKIHTDFDRGFYAAWSDYMLITTRDLSNTKTEDKTIETESESEPEKEAEPTE
jgi:hypothetical protein